MLFFVLSSRRTTTNNKSSKMYQIGIQSAFIHIHAHVHTYVCGTSISLHILNLYHHTHTHTHTWLKIYRLYVCVLRLCICLNKRWLVVQSIFNTHTPTYMHNCVHIRYKVKLFCNFLFTFILTFIVCLLTVLSMYKCMCVGIFFKFSHLFLQTVLSI